MIRRSCDTKTSPRYVKRKLSYVVLLVSEAFWSRSLRHRSLFKGESFVLLNCLHVNPYCWQRAPTCIFCVCRTHRFIDNCPMWLVFSLSYKIYKMVAYKITDRRCSALSRLCPMIFVAHCFVCKRKQFPSRILPLSHHLIISPILVQLR